KTQKAYQDIVAALGALGAESGAMFGMPSAKVGGKAFAGVFGNALVFKLTGEAHARALKLSGAEVFDRSGMGRPMKEWVVVSAANARAWPELAREALNYVAGAKPKPAKKAAPKATRKSSR